MSRFKTLKIKLLFYISILLFELLFTEVWNLFRTGNLISMEIIFQNILLYLFIGIMLFILVYNFFKLKHYKKSLFSKTILSMRPVPELAILFESFLIGAFSLFLIILVEKLTGLKPRGTFEPSYPKSWKEIIDNSPYYVFISLYLSAITYLIGINDKINKNCP